MTAGARWPAEWERHDATWIAWPHNAHDWPGKFEPIPWVYAEIVRALHLHERVEILCHDERVRANAVHCLTAHGVDMTRVRVHVCPTDRSWLRDSAPTAVRNASGAVELVSWGFNAWAKYENYSHDAGVGLAVARLAELPLREPQRPDGKGRAILEGGGIETDGLGTLLVTEEWLLSDSQVRNPGLGRTGYERLFADALGITKTIWLGEGCAGDDTHGHVDDIARFTAPGVVVLAHEEDPADENHRTSLDNLHRLRSAKDARGEALRVVTLPFPRAVTMNGQRLPASYANFYVANDVVMVPTFNDPNDGTALSTLAALFPERVVVGIHAVDLVWGMGTLHCLTQQQIAGARGESSKER
ncbi:MAG TPA: agmatine deiminase family protein [Gemmatimonadaceae bacterium]|nr:agmatine deiminase family protein [Gemmatimonadaceae bacterium]